MPENTAKRQPHPIALRKNTAVSDQIKKQVLTARKPEHLGKNPNPPTLMNAQKSKNHKLVKRHLDKVVLLRPALTVPETMLVEVMVNDVAVALQQNNSYKKQNYANHHTPAQGLCTQTSWVNTHAYKQ
jgi:hypothetical protein